MQVPVQASVGTVNRTVRWVVEAICQMLPKSFQKQGPMWGFHSSLEDQELGPW